MKIRNPGPMIAPKISETFQGAIVRRRWRGSCWRRIGVGMLTAPNSCSPYATATTAQTPSAQPIGTYPDIAAPRAPINAPVTAPVVTEPRACQPSRRTGVEDPFRSTCFGAATTPATDIPQVDQFAASDVTSPAPITAVVKAVVADGVATSARPAPA